MYVGLSRAPTNCCCKYSLCTWHRALRESQNGQCSTSLGRCLQCIVGGLVAYCMGGLIDLYGCIKTSRTGRAARAMCERVFNLLSVHIACVMLQPLEIGDDYCGEHDINHPIRGTEAVSATAAVTWSDDDVTSVAAATTGNHTVAFVGTRSGQVKKVLSAIFIFYHSHC